MRLAFLIGFTLAPMAQCQGLSWFIDFQGNDTVVTVHVHEQKTVSGTRRVLFSADEIDEHIRTLADGTRITEPGRVVHAFVDSHGRVRSEMPALRRGESRAVPSLIEITDPIAGFRYFIVEGEKVVHRYALTLRPAVPDARRGEVAAPPQPRTSAHVDSRGTKTTSEVLGRQMIDGIVADGARTTMIFPIDSQGNDRPLTVTRETWTSPELRTVVLSRSNDPRIGEIVFRMANVKMAEPDPALFQPPPDFTILDERKTTFVVTLKGQ